MEHDINLNIHYTASDEIWASVESSGLQFAGSRPDHIWDELRIIKGLIDPCSWV